MSKSIIGCDLNERYCQISYYNEEQQEPQTLENVTYPVADLYRKAVEHASMQLLITSLFLLIANTHSGDDALMGHTRSHPEHDG